MSCLKLAGLLKPLAGFALLCLVACPAKSEVIFAFDFEGASSWSGASTDVLPATPMPIEPAIASAAVGTIVQANTDQASGGLQLSAEIGEVSGTWQALFHSGLLPVTNPEVDPAKLTLAFDLAASIARPVVVRMESFDAQKRRTGGMESTIYPAAPNFHQRFAVDLSDMKPVGGGAFRPTDPFVQLTFVIAGPDFPSGATHSLQVDNVSYASPAFYVSPSGSDANDGRTDKTPFEHPQKALDAAKPGDIILLMDGTYRRPPTNNEQNGIIQVDSGGTPASWIVIKNYPGHKPVLFNDDSWNSIRLGGPIRDAAVPEKEVAYVEVRGLHMRGNNENIKRDHAADIDQPKPNTNGNAIVVDPRSRTRMLHHFRIADNLIELHPGGGVATLGGDRIQIENNQIHNNCWFMIYAGSGISILTPDNFDTTENAYKILIRNNVVTGNRCYIKWKQIGKMSDGNGIIVDSTITPEKKYVGRTLVQNNLAVNNGGSGIHSFKSNRIDIVNNTAYLNAATPELRWGQIFVQRADDVLLANNILWARDDQPVNTVSKSITDQGNTNIVRKNNVYFRGTAPIIGQNDVVTDPLFVNATTEPGTFDFRLQPDSPAIGRGAQLPITPLTDILGKRRPLDGPPDAGAFQR